MEFGELFGKSWKEYKSNFGVFFKIFLWFYMLPLIVFGILSLVFLGELQNSSVGSLITLVGSPFFITFAIISTIVTAVLYFFMTISFIYISIFKNESTKMKFRQAIRGGAHYFWTYVGLSLLLIVCLIPLYLLLIIPGIIFSIYWAFAGFVLLRENIGPWESMKRSKRIVKGRWWKVFGNLFILGIILWVISLIFSIPDFIFNLFSGGFISSGELPSLSTGYLVGSFILKIIKGFAILITLPLTTLFSKNLYLFLRTNPHKR